MEGGWWFQNRESQESADLSRGTWARETDHGSLAFARREVPLFQGGQDTALVISTSFLTLVVGPQQTTKKTVGLPNENKLFRTSERHVL
jgi:hypothetical protein